MTIIEQQLELELGDDYNQVVEQVKNYVKYIIARPWWGKNKRQMLNNEGDYPGLLTSALLSVIEHGGDVRAGLQELTARLNKEYSPQYNDKGRLTATNHTTWLPLQSLEDDKFPPPPSTPIGGVPGEPLQGLVADVDETHELLENDPDAEQLFRTLAAIGGTSNALKEAIALLDWPYRRGYNAYYRVKHKARYREKRQTIASPPDG